MLSADERARVEAAIGVAERGTAGELFCIISRERHRYPSVVLSVAALVAFTLPLLAVALGIDFARALPTDWGDEATLRPALEAYAAAQAALFVGTAALLWFTGAGRLLAPLSVRRDRVHDIALRQFLAKGLHMTAGRTGVLLFVSAPDRVAEVIADADVHAKVPAEHWGETVAALTDGIRRGRAADGFVAAIALAGAVLAEQFPPRADDVNELPDRIVEI